MPHVLWELQGLQTAVFEEEEHNGARQVVFRKFEQVAPGPAAPEEYDEFVRDTVNFLDYIGEPMKLKRQSLGHPRHRLPAGVSASSPISSSRRSGRTSGR